MARLKISYYHTRQPFRISYYHTRVRDWDPKNI